MKSDRCKPTASRADAGRGDGSRTGRRSLLVAAGGIVATLSGCLGEEETGAPAYEDGEVGDVDGEERTTEQAMAAEAHAEDEIREEVVVVDDLRVADHEFVLENGFEGPTIQGTVENTSGSRVDIAEVRVRVYGDGGEQLGQYLARTGDFDDGGVWEFQVILLEAPEDIADYDITVLGTPT